MMNRREAVRVLRERFAGQRAQICEVSVRIFIQANLVALFAGFPLLLTGCSEPNAPEPSAPESADYFPRFRQNDMVYWDFEQETERPSTTVHWEGVQRWDVLAMEMRAETVLTTMRRIFSGRRLHFIGPVDTTYNGADTSTFVLREVGDSVAIALAGQGQLMSFVCRPFTLARTYPPLTPAEVTVSPIPYLTVRMKRGLGLTLVSYGNASHSSHRIHYSRLEAAAVPSMEADDYFPAMNVGDTVLWDFQQTYWPAQNQATIWEGVIRWSVTGVERSGFASRFRIERTFSGRRRTIAAITETTFVHEDRSEFTVEDSARAVVVPLAGSGAEVTYYGPQLRFERLFPTRYGDVVRFSPVPRMDVTVRRGVGIVALQYYDPAVPTYRTPGYRLTYFRRQ